MHCKAYTEVPRLRYAEAAGLLVATAVEHDIARAVRRERADTLQALLPGPGYDAHAEQRDCRPEGDSNIGPVQVDDARRQRQQQPQIHAPQEGHGYGNPGGHAQQDLQRPTVWKCPQPVVPPASKFVDVALNGHHDLIAVEAERPKLTGRNP